MADEVSVEDKAAAAEWEVIDLEPGLAGSAFALAVVHVHTIKQEHLATA